ncbi:MAG: pentapeptide repeat-containing protein, partial [Gemmatimonadales bacterium]
MSCVAAALGLASLAGQTPGEPRAVPLAVLEFVTVDASARPDEAGVRALLRTSGATPERWLANALASGGRYAPMDERAVARALAVHRPTPHACADPACAVSVARSLGAERVVTGQLSKLSNLVWFLYATLVDVPSGRVVHVEEFELKGNIVDLLAPGMRALARRLEAHDRARRLTRDEVLRALAAATEQAPADLSDTDLSGLDLAGVDFKRANLSRSRLAGTNLSRAHLFAATLRDAVATDAKLDSAVLDVAVLERADLQRADLRGASLYATILTGADLRAADLSEARMIAAAAGARLAGAKLVRAHLGADPGNQPMGLMRTDLTGADLRGADLRGADLRKVDLTRADLTDADLSDANLAGAVVRSIRGRERVR